MIASLCHELGNFYEYPDFIFLIPQELPWKNADVKEPTNTAKN